MVQLEKGDELQIQWPRSGRWESLCSLHVEEHFQMAREAVRTGSWDGVEAPYRVVRNSEIILTDSES
jgi:hypothetical protein